MLLFINHRGSQPNERKRIHEQRQERHDKNKFHLNEVSDIYISQDFHDVPKTDRGFLLGLDREKSSRSH